MSLRYEGFNLVCRVVAGVKVGPDDGLDDLGVVHHLGHHSVLHVLQPRRLHGRGYLGLLPLGNSSEANS